jgi:tRNA(Arg) A34 adenosine deaminase TadA
MPNAPSPPSDPNDPLARYWNRCVSDLVTINNSPIGDEDAERHTIFALLTMALVRDAWNGNKHGPWGTYPWRVSQLIQPGLYAGDRYLGHNIGCIAVDGSGAIIDFDFNHNEIFNSSAEHAEARLIRRVFDLNQNYDGWQAIDPSEIPPANYANILSGVTLYTSLESCAQCSGIMTLGNVKSVVYLQSDPGQYRIGNILYNLSNPWSVTHPHSRPEEQTPPATLQKYGAPESIGAEMFGFPLKAFLEKAYYDFTCEIRANPAISYFWKPAQGSDVDARPSITSFLCTDSAKQLFDQAAMALANFELRYPNFPPKKPGQPNVLTNKQALEQAIRFRSYVQASGRRGTPHK